MEELLKKGEAIHSSWVNKTFPVLNIIIPNLERKLKIKDGYFSISSLGRATNLSQGIESVQVNLNSEVWPYFNDISNSLDARIEFSHIDIAREDLLQKENDISFSFHLLKVTKLAVLHALKEGYTLRQYYEDVSNESKELKGYYKAGNLYITSWLGLPGFKHRKSAKGFEGYSLYPFNCELRMYLKGSSQETDIVIETPNEKKLKFKKIDLIKEFSPQIEELLNGKWVLHRKQYMINKNYHFKN